MCVNIIQQCFLKGYGMKQYSALLVMMLYSVSLFSQEADFPVYRIGRFGYEDSFDFRLVNKVIKGAPAEVKRMMINLLYPPKNRAAIPKRLLLVGQPGTGKTALAKAIAIKCNYQYYIIEAPFLLNEYKNSGQQNLLREIYPLLESGDPIVVIIDEITELTDNYGKDNNSDSMVSSALWLLLDLCAQYPNVFFIGTSNKERKDLPAQLKSRFDEDIITIPLPGVNARRAIIEHNLNGEQLDLDDTYLHYLVSKTKGRSAREVEKIVLKAIQYANSSSPKNYTITKKDFEKALALWKSLWHPQVLYEKYEPYIKPFFTTAFPIILQFIGTVTSIYFSCKQLDMQAVGLLLQKQGLELQIETSAKQHDLQEKGLAFQGQGLYFQGHALARNLFGNPYGLTADRLNCYVKTWTEMIDKKYCIG